MKLALIGMMGTGKTATGMRLAEKLNTFFADLDDMIVARAGMSIAQTFITFGEKVFRAYENSVLYEVVWHENIVISCGGGATLSPENAELLKDFTKIRLRAQPETIFARIKDDFSRPLIKDNSPKALQKIIDEREENYAFHADFTVDTDFKTVDEVVNKILEMLNL